MPYELPPEEFFPPHHRQGLFYSEAWQQAWLKAYGDHPTIQLHPQAGVYTYRQWLKRLIPVRTATLIGATSSATRSMRAEYAGLTDKALSASLSTKWDQLVLSDILEGSEDEKRLYRFIQDNDFGVRETARDPIYAVDLREGTFEDYLARLGKNSRLKLYNRRKRLEQAGDFTIENLWPDRDRFYRALNQFYKQRWGHSFYQGRSRLFIDTLTDLLSRQGCHIDFSTMSVSGVPVSVTLDIGVNGRVYNVLAGFDQTWSRDVSLGMIHFGHQIEKAYSNRVSFYDFLAGSGKRTNYKKSITNATSNFKSFSIIRSRSLKLASRAYGP